MTTFEQHQQSMQAQMQQSMSATGSDGQIDEAARELSSAAQNISMGANQQTQQSQALGQTVQATQAQITNLSNNVQSLVNEMRMQQMQTSAPAPPMVHPQPMGPPPQAAPPPMAGPPMGGGQPAGGGMMDNASTGAGIAAGYVGGQIQGAGNAISGAHHQMAMNNQSVQFGHAPGALQPADTSLTGALGPASMGITFNPMSAQQYTGGAQQRAMARRGGRAVGDTLGGMFMGGTSLMGAGGLANMGSAALGGPLGMGASALGIPGMLASPLDAINPVAHAGEEFQRSVAFEGGVDHRQHEFMRGRGGGRDDGFMNIEEEAEIGRRLTRGSRMEVGYSQEDMMELQEGLHETGQMLGVQTAEDYERRFQEAKESHRKIMKTLNKTSEEAVQLMDSMFDEMGLNHGAEMQEMTTRIQAGGHVSGMGAQQMAEMAAAGARGAGGFGLMASTGAEDAISAQEVAGQAATHTMDTDLLASVGGEAGLGQLFQQAQGQFLAGAGGTMLGLGGTFTSLDQGLSQAMGGIGGMGDMMEMHVDRHNMLGDLDSEDRQAQMIVKIMDIAKEMAEGTDMSVDHVARSIMTEQFGMSPTEAESMMETFRSMPETMKRRRRMRSQERSDHMRDIIMEDADPMTQLRRGSRGFADASGARAVGDAFQSGYQRAGRMSSVAGRRAADAFVGVDETFRHAENIRAIGIDDFGTADAMSTVDVGDIMTDIDISAHGGGRDRGELRERVGSALRGEAGFLQKVTGSGAGTISKEDRLSGVQESLSDELGQDLNLEETLQTSIELGAISTVEARDFHDVAGIDSASDDFVSVSDARDEIRRDLFQRSPGSMGFDFEDSEFDDIFGDPDFESFLNQINEITQAGQDMENAREEGRVSDAREKMQELQSLSGSAKTAYRNLGENAKKMADKVLKERRIEFDDETGAYKPVSGIFGQGRNPWLSVAARSVDDGIGNVDSGLFEQFRTAQGREGAAEATAAGLDQITGDLMSAEALQQGENFDFDIGRGGTGIVEVAQDIHRRRDSDEVQEIARGMAGSTDQATSAFGNLLYDVGEGVTEFDHDALVGFQKMLQDEYAGAVHGVDIDGSVTSDHRGDLESAISRNATVNDKLEKTLDKLLDELED